MSALHRVQHEPILRKVMPELDTIRGLAVIGVLFTHGFYNSTNPRIYHSVATKLALYATIPGRFGVNLFFVLSGFLITGILIESRRQTNYYKRFYVRRSLRILPVFYLVLAILLLGHLASGRFIALSVVYLSNMTPLWGIPIGYIVLWSLAVEEHFYLLWPAFVRNCSLTAIAICSAAIILVSPLIRLLSFHLSVHDGIRASQYVAYTWNASDGLACGALVAVLLRLAPTDRRKLWRIALWILATTAAMFAVGAPFGILTRERLLGAALQPTPWNFLFVALLLIFLLLGSSDRKNLVVNPVLRFFGEISYGLYLYHVLVFYAYDMLTSRYFPSLAGAVRSDLDRSLVATPAFGLLSLRFVLVISASVAIAYASRVWFENPFLRLKDRFSKPQSISASGSVVASDHDACATKDASPSDVPKRSSAAAG